APARAQLQCPGPRRRGCGRLPPPAGAGRNRPLIRDPRGAARRAACRRRPPRGGDSLRARVGAPRRLGDGSARARRWAAAPLRGPTPRGAGAPGAGTGRDDAARGAESFGRAQAASRADVKRLPTICLALAALSCRGKPAPTVDATATDSARPAFEPPVVINAESPVRYPPATF